MSLKKIATSATVIAAMLAGQMGPLANAANAGDRGYGYSYDDSYRDFDRGPRREFHRDYDRRDYRRHKRHAYDYDDHHHHRKHKRKDRTGRDLAIGLSALMIGAIIASEASRHRGY